MVKDIRSPTAIGEKLLKDAVIVRQHYGADIPMSEIWDLHVSKFLIENYADNETSIEKYGKPSDLVPGFAEIQIR